VIVRRVGQPFGPLGALARPSFAQAEEDLSVQVKPSTAAAGLGLWVLGGVLTHLAIRAVDSWLDRRK
jgi:hypothetical protein